VAVVSGGEFPPFTDVPSVQAQGQVKYQLGLPVQDQVHESEVTLKFTPNGAPDGLEATLRLLPSYFLLPAEESELEAAKAEATLQQELNLSEKGDAKKVLQIIVNILRGSILTISNPPGRIVFARALSGPPVVATVRVEKVKDIPRLLVILTSSNQDLLDALVREIQAAK
jgi:hypothetical protein